MKLYTVKPLLAAVLLAASCAAQAAHFEVIGYGPVFGGYSGNVNDAEFSSDANDLSANGDVTVFGTGMTDESSYGHGYAADGYLMGGKQFWMTTMQYLSANPGVSYTGDTVLSMPTITLKIVSDGEAIGSALQVSFAGLASSTGSFGSTSGSLMMDMAVTSGNTTLGSFLSDGINGDQAINFSFAAKVGDQMLLSGFMGSNMTADGLQAVDMASVAGSLGGEFAIAAVPEPEQYAMLLAGLGLLAAAARRRNR